MTNAGAPPEILVVDDEAIIRMELTMELGDLGFVVHEADNVAAALAILEGNPAIKAGVFDVQLSGDRTGYDLVRIVRERRPHFIVMVITGSGFAMPDGFDEHIMIESKPVDSRKIAHAMRSKLGRPDG